jgi:phytoene desaturase
MEFPVLFLGAMPNDTPALYSLMNYAGLKLGTWYPDGGFGKVIDAMVEIAKENKVKFNTNSAIERINIENGVAKSLSVNGLKIEFDAIVGSADYQHIESKLLDKKYRNYDEEYWNKKVFAPSCLIYYLGFNKAIDNLQHHTLFFDEDLDQHAIEIYKEPQWPTKPLFYVCCPSKTDENVAPKGHENVFLLMPLAPGIEDNDELRAKYFDIMMNRLEAKVGMEIRHAIDYQKSYCINDFVMDYNSYKGNAYGLANTLMQTANLKPKMINKKVKNLFYTGQLTVPGPGVPPSIISGNVVSKLVDKYLNF